MCVVFKKITLRRDKSNHRQITHAYFRSKFFRRKKKRRAYSTFGFIHSSYTINNRQQPIIDIDWLCTEHSFIEILTSLPIINANLMCKWMKSGETQRRHAASEKKAKRFVMMILIHLLLFYSDLRDRKRLSPHAPTANKMLTQIQSDAYAMRHYLFSDAVAVLLLLACKRRSWCMCRVYTNTQSVV